jgi:two-component system cell cycle sensor histidine kinase/response regulator CckA
MMSAIMSDDRPMPESTACPPPALEAAALLATGIAHDFNNILAGILSHLDLALCTGELTAAARENLGFAQTSARRGAEMAGQLTLVGRSRATECRPVPLPHIISRLSAPSLPALDPPLAIRWTGLPAETCSIMADENQIILCLTTLCLNLRNHLPPGKEIWLATSEVSLPEMAESNGTSADSFLRLSIGDSPDPPPVEARHPLFNAFPPAGASSSGAQTDLGLILAYYLVRAHRGWMEIECDNPPGACQRLHLYLPRATPPPSITSPDPQPANFELQTEAAFPPHAETVLVADDEELVRLVVRTVLSYRGYHVLEASSGEQAVELLLHSGRKIDLAVLDVHMPRLNGWDTLAQLRRHQPGLVAIMLSGAPSESESEKAALVGNLKFLPKPFENHDLARLVRKMLDSTSANAASHRS